MMLRNSVIIARRDLRDSLRDWRIITPIALLTFAFPALMLGFTQLAFNYAHELEPKALFATVIPFAIMIVGFFPISFCLVIALEAFVVEKERGSLEPLLSTPIGDFELCLGKLLASLALPLCAAYSGIAIFIVVLKLFRQLDVPLWIVLQIGLLTGLEALLMVAGAVVISSHTTSIRAANLLASFIIIPMTLLLQVESVLLLNNRSELLWHISALMVVANVIVGRMSVRLFNREEILAREMDELHLRGILSGFWGYFTEGRGRFSLLRFYRADLSRLLARGRSAIVVTSLVMLGGLAFGGAAAFWFPFPPGMMHLANLSGPDFRRSLENASDLGIWPRFNTRSIFENNVQSLAAAGLLGLFSFGSLALILLLIPMAFVGFIAGQIWISGANPLQFLFAFILPHGIFELPAAILATALALQMGAALISPRANLTAGESLLSAFADFLRAFVFVVIPVLLVAAFVEANITPDVVIWMYGN
jgi:uncharacterized membrane protein SpoIIM required for sporulation/ABC-type transport system involved in multi-copper enzyme maturation permease subunit